MLEEGPVSRITAALIVVGMLENFAEALRWAKHILGNLRTEENIWPIIIDKVNAAVF